MRKVLIGTPAHDGRVDVWYANSLVNTIKMAMTKDIDITPVYMAYDSLVQRARNDLVRLAIEGDFDDLIFVDSDVEWDPEWIFKLLDYKEDVVGGIYPKKTDNPTFPIKAIDDKLEIGENGLMEVEGLPTGFMRISKSALKKVWDDSLEYRNEGRIGRMVFDIKVVNGDLVSEDIIFCQKWRDLGGKIWLDPSMTCNHIGIKKYTGNFLEFLKNLQGATS
jgi:glycosyltransferase involved in cell wall biosynthesis